MPIPRPRGPGGAPSSWLTDQAFDEMVQAWNVDGATSTELAERFGVSRGAILGVIHRYQDQFEGRSSASSISDRLKGDEPEIRRLYQEGISQDQIAKRLGVHPRTMVRKISQMRDAGILEPRKYATRRRKPRVQRGNRTPENLAVLVERYNAGHTFVDIGEVTGQSKSAVKAWAEQLISEGKLKRRPRSPQRPAEGRTRSGFFKDREVFDQLVHLWNVEHLTAKECAERLGEGCTRSKVLGVILRNRDRFEERESVGGRRHGSRPRKQPSEEEIERRKLARQESAARRKAKASGAGSKRGRKPRMPIQRGLASPPPKAPAGYRGPVCQYPMWKHDEKPTHVYCGAPSSAVSRSWCEYHRAICCRDEAA